MAITIGKKPESDFNNPLGLLSDCHRRIERFLNLLVTITRDAQGRELSAEQREALETALGYFKNAAPRHTLDEEESLFPRLRSANDKQAVEAMALLDRLHKDHETAEAMHNEVDVIVKRWLVEGALASAMAHRLADMLEGLSAIYQPHIAIEDAQVFPLADRILPRAEIEKIGREMAARRGIDLAAIARVVSESSCAPTP